MQPSTQDISTVHRTGLQPPRFTVRTLLIVTAAISLGLGAMRALGPIWTWVLLLFVAAIGAHVAGNVIGRRLVGQDVTRRRASLRERGDESAAVLPPSMLRPCDFAPRSQLSVRRPLGIGLLVVSVVCGVVGAVLSAVVLARMNPEAASLRTLLFGAVAGGVLSGLWVFWMLSLIRVAGAAWWEAHRHPTHSHRDLR